MLSNRFLAAFIAVSTIGLSLSAECLKTDGKPENLNDKNRVECLKQSRFTLNTPDLNPEEMLKALNQPPSKKNDLVNGQIVHCRYVFVSQNGQSTKFRCVRTNENNQLMDSKGTVVPEAISVVEENDELYLTDAQNQKLTLANKKDTPKPRKAYTMKVRYHDGNPRNTENYTSSAASRVFWALGVPAHSNYMTEKIVCFGCGKDPFRGQKEPLMQNGKMIATDFIDAAIEIKFDAERLYSPAERAWKWSDVNALSKKSTNEIRTEIEVLALASQFVGAIGTSDLQNALVCMEFDKANKDNCISVVAMAHDLGASFGNRLRKDSRFSGEYPRGDLSTYSTTKLFKRGSCEFMYSDGGRSLPPAITAAGKAEFLKRAQNLTAENLKMIVKASHMGRLANLNLKTNPSELEDKWVSAILNRLKEVEQAPCK